MLCCIERYSAAPTPLVQHMPTKNPRLSIVISPALAATLAELSEVTEQSSSSLVRGLLEQASPALRRMLELVRAAKAAQGQIGEGLAASMLRVVDDLADAVALADARQGRVLADLVEQAEAVPGRRRRVAAGGGRAVPVAAATPGLVTRGSGSTERGRKGGRRGSV